MALTVVDIQCICGNILHTSYKYKTRQAQVANSYSDLNAVTSNGNPTTSKKRAHSSVLLPANVDDMPAVKKLRDEKVNSNDASSSSSNASKELVDSKQDLQAESKKVKIYNLTGDDEHDVVPLFSQNALKIIVAYAGGDFDKNDDIAQPVIFFGEEISSLLNAEVTCIGNSFLCENNKEELKRNLALIAENPDFLHYYVIATDPLGRKVKGRLLEIALMAGMDCHVIESLVLQLPPAEVIKQLEVVMGSEAKQENEARNLCISSAIAAFGAGILNNSLDFRDLINRLLFLGNSLREALDLNQNQVRTRGNVFDLQNLITFVEWFINYFKHFELVRQPAIKCRIFWDTGLDLLKSRLSLPMQISAKNGINALLPNKSFCWDEDLSSGDSSFNIFGAIMYGKSALLGWKGACIEKAEDLQKIYNHQLSLQAGQSSSANAKADTLGVSTAALITSGIFSSSIRVAAASTASTTAASLSFTI